MDRKATTKTPAGGGQRRLQQLRDALGWNDAIPEARRWWVDLEKQDRKLSGVLVWLLDEALVRCLTLEALWQIDSRIRSGAKHV